jgi:hypothetical protein
MFGICGPLCYNVWIWQGFDIDVFIDTNNWMSQSCKTKLKRCQNLYPENHCHFRVMKANEMHYFSYLFGKVLYMFRTSPLSIIRSISKLYTPVAYPGILFGGGVQQIQLRTERTGIWRQWPPSQGFWRQL